MKCDWVRHDLVETTQQKKTGLEATWWETTDGQNGTHSNKNDAEFDEGFEMGCQQKLRRIAIGLKRKSVQRFEDLLFFISGYDRDIRQTETSEQLESMADQRPPANLSTALRRLL